MEVVNFKNDIHGEIFPAGRLTKIIVGPNSTLKAKNFVLGYVTIFPGGSVPKHNHPEEEVYTIISGEGEMSVADEKQILQAGTSVYIASNLDHSLKNKSNENVEMIFVYAPLGIVKHWEKERKGLL